MSDARGLSEALIYRPFPYGVQSPSRLSRLCVVAYFVLMIVASARSGFASGRQLSLAAIDQLPNAPSTYEMRDWLKTATDFDNLAFDTEASGQFLPLVRIDQTPESSQLSQAFGLAAYVGETRTFGENGERVHESLASLGAVLGGTLAGIDKSAGPYNWVAMAREYYVDRNSQFIVLNNPFEHSGNSAWYEVYPNILFYSIADRYSDEPLLHSAMDTIDGRFYSAVNNLTAGGTAPNFNYTAYNFATQQPVYNGIWREPDMGLGMAWLQHAAYWRNRDSNPSQAEAHLDAVDWSLAYYENTSNNPDYEILLPFGAYTAARMNAEQGRNFDVHKLVRWVFDRSNARPTKIMIGGQQWGGQDVGGLMGFIIPNTPEVRGYAFSMNSFATAMPIVPLARYEDRYSRAIGKWMLNAANAARLFYSDEHSAANQSSEFWTGDPNSSIAYEGLRHHWLGGQFDGEELYAAGDPLTYGWGPQTDFSIYGAAMTGVFGSIIKTTNVEKILQLDLLATDFYRDEAHSTYLYYNPLATTQSVAIDLGNGTSYDLYDAVSNRYLSRNTSGQTHFNIPSDEAVMLVLVPSGGTETRDGRRLLVDGVVVDYNATMLPDNLVRNGDVDAAHASDPSRPGFWHYSSNASWSDEVALSPTHSLELVDNSTTRFEEWRTYATDLTEGEGRSLQLRWFWKYDVAEGEEFRARLRLSNDAATTLDLTNTVVEVDFTISGEALDFEMFETTIELPDGVRSFDLTFISGGALNATGFFYIDDISAAVLKPPVLAGDFNGDGFVDAADYTVWRNNYGDPDESDLNFSGDGGDVGATDYAVWKSHYGDTLGSGSGGLVESAAVPEASALLLLLIGATIPTTIWRMRCRVTVMGALIVAAAAPCGNATAAENDVDCKINRVALMPNLPEPFEMRDWDQVTQDYLNILLDFDRTGDHLPLIEWADESRKMVALPAYVGGPRDPEAINYLAALVSGTLVGIDMTTYDDQDWVTIGTNFFNPEEGIYLNRLHGHTGRSFWYDIFPNVLFYQINALYPDDPQREKQAHQVAERWRQACVALGGSSDPPSLPNFEHTGFLLKSMEPIEHGWIEPEAAAGIGWLEYMAWLRFKDPRFLTAADWCIRSLETRPVEKSPLYEVLLPYGALAAARMNAELGRNYDVNRILNDCFEPRGRPQARPGWGVICDRWNGEDAYGLVGSATDGQGYAFAMNTFQWAGAIVPIARYDTRYAHDIGKWVLNLANAARLFYPNAHDDEHQSSYGWSKAHDPKSAIAYEGIRKWKRGAALARSDYRTVNGRTVRGSYASTHFRRESPMDEQVLEKVAGAGPFEHVWELDLPDANQRWLEIAAKCREGRPDDKGFCFSISESPDGQYRDAFSISGTWSTQVAEVPVDWRGTLYVKAESCIQPGENGEAEQLVVDAMAVTYQSNDGPFAQGDSLVSFVALLENATAPIVLYRPATAATDMGLYGSSHVGILGGIIEPTNVEHILQLDLLQTDYYHADAYPTYLYYNPNDTKEAVALDVGSESRDVYDATIDELLLSGVTGNVAIDIPADSARVLVIAPANGLLRRENGQTLIDDVVVRFKH